MSVCVCVQVLIAQEKFHTVQVHTNCGKCHNERFKIKFDVIRFHCSRTCRERERALKSLCDKILMKTYMTTGALRLYFIKRVERKWEYMYSIAVAIVVMGCVAMLIAACYGKLCTVNQHFELHQVDWTSTNGNEFDGWWLVYQWQNRHIPFMEPYGEAFK